MNGIDPFIWLAQKPATRQRRSDESTGQLQATPQDSDEKMVTLLPPQIKLKINYDLYSGLL